MARTYPWLMAVAVLVGCSPGPSRAAGSDAPSGRFRVIYGPAIPEYAAFRERLVSNQFLDTVASRLNDSLRIPKDITLATSHCEEPNASYDPATRRVSLCYELFKSLGERFASETGGDYLVAGTIVFALMHETAHALIDVLDLPTTGREDDAADQLATLLLLDEGAAGDSLAFGAVGWLATNASANPLDTLAFADDHALNIQRVYNILCLIYGRDPAKYPEVVEDGWLPAQRRDRCPEEYRRFRDNWRRLLAPYHRQGGRPTT